MGIKHFFSWFKQNKQLKNTIINSVPETIDHVLIDMNGVIHEAAQFVFKYGKYKSKIEIPNYLKSRIKRQTNEDLYLEIKNKVNAILETLNPKKAVFLAVDGVAPKSKQNQQRQRRFRAAAERDASEAFDSNCITAGTAFMKELSDSLTKDVREWITVKEHVDVIMSPDSIPGEGEHKLIDWINAYSSPSDVFCIVGLDADLILLCMMAYKENIYIMREGEQRVDYIDISLARHVIPIAADDLIILSCFIGNDFLPAIPSLEIKESAPEIGALDYFIDYYSKHPETTLVNRRNGCINMTALRDIMTHLSFREQCIMDARHNDSSRFDNDMWTGDIEKYRDVYHKTKLEQVDPSVLVQAYMKTVQWVYLYYSKHLEQKSSWDWYYPYNYSLHANYFAKHIPQDIVRFSFPKSVPSHPHEQLLRVIPPQNKYLIPAYLHSEYDVMINESTQLFKIDKTGKREAWEAITIVDFVNPQNISYQ